MTLLDLVSFKYSMSCGHTLTTLKTNLTSDIRDSVRSYRRLRLCCACVSPQFVTNSLVLTVHEPNETQSLFLLYHQRNEKEIMS